MGPQRHNWSFPHTGSEIVAAIEAQIAELAAHLDASISAEGDYERRLAEYRETLRVAGVKFWETARLDPTEGLPTYSRGGNPEQAFRTRQKQLAGQVVLLRRWLLALRHDIQRDPLRAFKLSADDLEFFGLTDPTK